MIDDSKLSDPMKVALRQIRVVKNSLEDMLSMVDGARTENDIRGCLYGLSTDVNILNAADKNIYCSTMASIRKQN